MKSCLLVLLVLAVGSVKTDNHKKDDHQSISDDRNYDECLAPKASKDFTPLCYAVMRGQLENVKGFYVLGANFKNTTCGGARLWHLAAAFGQESVIKYLLYYTMRKEDRNGFSEENCTMMHYAARNGYIKTAYTMYNLHSDMDVSIKTPKGYTALDLAEYAYRYNAIAPNS